MATLDTHSRTPLRGSPRPAWALPGTTAATGCTSANVAPRGVAALRIDFGIIWAIDAYAGRVFGVDKRLGERLGRWAFLASGNNTGGRTMTGGIDARRQATAG